MNPNDNILSDVVKAIYSGMTIERINELSSIDPWFLNKIKNIVEMEIKFKKSSNNFQKNIIREAKKLGFSDKQLLTILT